VEGFSEGGDDGGGGELWLRKRRIGPLGTFVVEAGVKGAEEEGEFVVGVGQGGGWGC
jgi:hypothetical protein